MKRKWCSLILLKLIIQEIPEFLATVFSAHEDREILRTIGTYTLQTLYDIESLSLNDFNHLLYCEKHDRANDLMLEKMLCFTQTTFLEMDIVRAPNTIYLRVVKAKDIRTILYLKRKMKHYNYICLGFGKQSTKLYQDQEVEHHYYLIPNVDEMIDKLLAIATLNDATISNNTVIQKLEDEKSKQKPALNDIPQPEVVICNHKYVSREKMEDLLRRIAELESIIEEELDYDFVQELVDCYGKATEYLSHDPTSDYRTYTIKTQKLLARPEIQAVLDSNNKINEIDKELDNIINKWMSGDNNTGNPEITQDGKQDPNKKFDKLGKLIYGDNYEKRHKAKDEDLDKAKETDQKIKFQFASDDEEENKKEIEVGESKQKEPEEAMLLDNDQPLDNITFQFDEKTTCAADLMQKPTETDESSYDLLGMDLLGLNVDASSSADVNKRVPDTQEVMAEKTPEKNTVDYFDPNDFQIDQKEEKSSGKLIKRRKNNDSTPKEPEFLEDKEKPSPVITTPVKEEPQESDLARIQRMLTESSNKKSTGTPSMIKKDSFSDEENKYVIG